MKDQQVVHIETKQKMRVVSDPYFCGNRGSVVCAIVDGPSIGPELRKIEVIGVSQLALMINTPASEVVDEG